MSGRRWNGSAFTDLTTKKRHNGSEFVDVTVGKRYDGSSWIDVFAAPQASPTVVEALHDQSDSSRQATVTTGSGTLDTDLLIVAGYDDWGSTPFVTPSSTGGGTWTSLTSNGDSPQGSISAWSKPAHRRGETITTDQGDGNGRALIVWVVRGASGVRGSASSGDDFTQSQSAPTVACQPGDLQLNAWGMIHFSDTTGAVYTLPGGTVADANASFDGNTATVAAVHADTTGTATVAYTATTTVDAGDGQGRNAVAVAVKPA